MYSFTVRSDTLLPFFLLAATLTGCSVLVGQVKPVDEKRESPFWLDVAQISPDWARIKSKNYSSSDNNDDHPDAAWQSNSTAAIISINSACRDTTLDSNEIEVTDSLLDQWDNLQIQTQRQIRITDFPAYETVATGAYLGRKRSFKIVVIRGKKCMYDLELLSTPETFTKNLIVFEKFKTSLHLD